MNISYELVQVSGNAMQNAARQVRREELEELYTQMSDPKLDRVDEIINSLEDQLEVAQGRMQTALKAMQSARQLIGYADAFHAPKVIAELEDAIAKTRKALVGD